MLITFSAVAACRPRNPSAPSSIHIAVPHEIATFDPHATATLSHLTMVLNVYEPLVTTDKDMRLGPCLADAWENPDARTWLFRLRSGVRFHSGHVLRTADVVYSIRRALDFNGIAILAPYVEEVTAPDEKTVRIRTFRPFSALLNKLRFVPIVAEGATAGSFSEGGDGTGPYRIEAWQKGDWIRFRRHEGYWGAAPALETVTFHMDRGPEQALQDLLSGRCQIARCDSQACVEGLTGSDRFTLVRRQGLLVRALVFGMSSEPSPYISLPFNPFRDRRVREAVNLAVDRARLCRRLTSRAEPANQAVPRLVFGFNPEIPDSRPDPGRARTLLHEAGLGAGFDLTLQVRGLLSEAGEAVREQLQEVGIRARTQSMPWAEFQDVLETGHVGLYLAGYACVTGDASDVLDHWVHSYDPKRRLGLGNYGRYANPEVDRRIEESAGIDNPQKRQKAIQEVLALCLQDLAWIPLYTDETVFAIDRSLTWASRYDGLLLAAEIAPRRAEAAAP